MNNRQQTMVERYRHGTNTTAGSYPETASGRDGQAVKNANLMFSLEETSALDQPPFAP